MDEAGASKLIGDSPAMRSVLDLVERVADTSANVLILGESGVGKRSVAAAIHAASAQAHGPFHRFVCGAVPDGQAEGELFASAQGGTLFLDEVGYLSPTLQARLLGLLPGCRIVASTSRDLEAQVAAETFRKDLYYRLNVFPISVPPLRARGSDVFPLAHAFLARAARLAGKRIRGLSPAAAALLAAHSWPGNVRELENCMQRAIILTDDELVHVHHLPGLHPRALPASPSSADGLAPGTGLEDHLAVIEKGFVVRALEACRGNMAEAARRLGLTKRMMLLRVEKFGLDYQSFRR